jgi:hypothetical protein
MLAILYHNLILFNHGINKRIHPTKRFLVSKWSSKMENQTLVVLDGNQVSIESLRIGVAEAVKRAYGAERAYAKGLNQIFAFDWFMVEANDTSDDAKTVKVEKTLLYTAAQGGRAYEPFDRMGKDSQVWC